MKTFIHFLFMMASIFTTSCEKEDTVYTSTDNYYNEPKPQEPYPTPTNVDEEVYKELLGMTIN